MQVAVFVFASLVALGALFTLAYAAEKTKELRYLVYILFGGFDLLSILLWLAYTAVFVLGTTVDFRAPQAMGGFLEGIVSASPVLLALSVAAFLLLFPPLMRPLSRLIPVDPDRVVHAVALQFAVYLLLLSTVIAVFVSTMSGDTKALEDMAGTALTGAGALASAWGQTFGLVALSFLGVGLFVRRTPREAMVRLGLTRSFSWRWFLFVVGMGLVSGWLVDASWRALDPAGMEQVSRISEVLFKSFLDAGLIGALTVASAGLGEELVFRGAAQTRFGIALTAFLFAALHTQYTVSPALLQVFFLAVLLGVARVRSSTTTCILAHATYNFVLVLLAIYAPNVGP